MRIGYPCINWSLGAVSHKRFRLASFTEARFIETVAANLDGLRRLIEHNRDAGFLFFRITSDLVPFASHPVCRVSWQTGFVSEFARIGRLIRSARMRISMHPDQFTLLNSPDPKIVDASRRELAYHAEVLDLLGLDEDAKMQIHVGGVYGDKAAAMGRFVQTVRTVDEPVRRRLVLEHDDRLFSLADTLRLHEETGVPVLFDALHHRLLHAGEPLAKAMAMAGKTWRTKDGLPMVDYSSQAPGARRGKHAESLDPEDFKTFVENSRPMDVDVMLEIKDKEKSAARALQMATGDPRLVVQGTAAAPV